jgi:hypothetical protein
LPAADPDKATSPSPKPLAPQRRRQRLSNQICALALLNQHLVKIIDFAINIYNSINAVSQLPNFKILHEYWRDPLAILIAILTFLALQVANFKLIPVVLVGGPIAMALYWPRARKSQAEN